MKRDAAVRRPRIGITLGDARGIGPEIVDRALTEDLPDADFLLIGPTGLGMEGGALESVGEWSSRGSAADAGRLAGLAIARGVELALDGTIDGLVTAPIDKAAFQAGGWPYPGHTEMLRALSNSRSVAMLMAAERTIAGGPLRVVLATTHLPLRDVPRLLTSSLLVEQVRLTAAGLRDGWGIDDPKVALCAFNPHASDGGLFGDEEARIYVPAIVEIAAAGIRVSDPLPADTVFRRAIEGEFDAVVAPYHDVGMAPFKTVSFGSGVNVTLGLPFPRTSPDHGTALDIAGRGIANHSSMLEAIRLAIRLAARDAL